MTEAPDWEALFENLEKDVPGQPDAGSEKMGSSQLQIAVGP